MLVRCPKCQTTYKVSGDVLTGSTPVFRCSRCKHTFELDANNASSEPPTERPPEAVGQSAPPPPDQELRLPFTATPEPARAGSDKREATELPAEEKNRERLKFGSGDHWSLSHDAPPEQPFTISETKRGPDTPKDFSLADRALPITNDKSENSHNILAISPYLEQRASILPFITLFGLLVIGFSLFAVISHANPAASEQVVKKIPLIGTSVLKNNHLKGGILIQSLRSGSQIIQGNREVLLITGVALNRNPVVVREIQLTGRIYNQQGKELDRQTIWVGNTLSPKIIRGMTIEDIPHLQNLKPLKSFEVPSGDSVPFTIVFLRSTKHAQDFTCEVVTAEGEV